MFLADVNAFLFSISLIWYMRNTKQNNYKNTLFPDSLLTGAPSLSGGEQLNPDL